MVRPTPVFAVAFLAVLLVLGLDLLHAFAGLNERIMDLQQRQVPRSVHPYSDRIVLVDIDDGSIDRMGRWPWPRATIADAIRELDRAGARTIAVDIEFSNPQPPRWDPELQAPREDDEVLARAIDPSVVMAAILADDELDQRWADAGGRPDKLAALVDGLRANITATPADPPAGLTLTPVDQAAFHANQLLAKRRAILAVLVDDDAPESLDELERRLVPAGHLHGADYAERPLLEAAWLQHQGIAGSRPFFSAFDPDRTGSPSDRLPLRTFIDTAGGVGYVNITHRGVDGGVRSIYPSQPVRDGEMLCLGLAAIAHYLDIPPSTIDIDDSAIVVGETSLPIHDGVIWLNWPRSETGWRWRDLHRRTASDPEYRGHLSISEVIEIARARRLLETQEAMLADVSRDLLRVIRFDPEVEVDDWLADDIQQEIREEILFSLEGVPISADPQSIAPGEDAETLDRLGAMQQWRRVREAVDQDRSRLEQGAQALADMVEDALVFVGWTSTGAAADFVSTVAGPRTPGVLVHATLADMVLQGRTLSITPPWFSVVAILGLGLLVSVLVASLSPWWATAGSLTSILMYLGLGGVAALAAGNIIVPIAAPVVAGLAAWIAGTGVQAALAQRDKRRITRQFRARVSDQLVDALIADPDAVSMSGVSREMSIFFADLAGFTTLSEQLGSTQIVKILNTYLSALTSQLVEHGAYVNKFLGDGVMAFWSAFREEEAQAHLSCAAALACQQTLADLNRLTGGEHPEIYLRVGIATGSAVVGDCGAPPDLNDYTVIGDTANLAARLESANKQFGTGIMINDRTHEQLGDAPVRCRLIGEIQVVGRAEPIRAWEVVDRHFPEAALTASRKLAEAIAAGDQPAAHAALSDLRSVPGQESFVERWAEMVEGPAAAFGGPLRLIEK